MYGFADLGLMAIGFFLTLILELLMSKKPARKAVSLGLVSALFLAFPGPVFTLSVVIGKSLDHLFPAKEKQKQLE
jgi:predicted branched-subunit amino acid permease